MTLQRCLTIPIGGLLHILTPAGGMLIVRSKGIARVAVSLISRPAYLMNFF